MVNKATDMLDNSLKHPGYTVFNTLAERASATLIVQKYPATSIPVSIYSVFHAI